MRNNKTLLACCSYTGTVHKIICEIDSRGNASNAKPALKQEKDFFKKFQHFRKKTEKSI